MFSMKEAAARFTERELEALCVLAIRYPSKSGMSVFGHCLRELAVRFDQRSFRNLCERIAEQGELPDDRLSWTPGEPVSGPDGSGSGWIAAMVDTLVREGRRPADAFDAVLRPGSFARLAEDLHGRLIV